MDVAVIEVVGYCVAFVFGFYFGCTTAKNHRGHHNGHAH